MEGTLIMGGIRILGGRGSWGNLDHGEIGSWGTWILEQLAWWRFTCGVPHARILTYRLVIVSVVVIDLVLTAIDGLC